MSVFRKTLVLRRPIGYLHSERSRLLLYTLSFAGTCVHLEWYTMVKVVHRKSLSALTWSSLKYLSLVFLLYIRGTKALEATTDDLNSLGPDDGVLRLPSSVARSGGLQLVYAPLCIPLYVLPQLNSVI